MEISASAAPETRLAPPPADQVAHLRPRDGAGVVVFGGALLATGAALGLAVQDSWGLWLAGELALAVVFNHWFAILHEAGHRTLFRAGWANRCAGHVAGTLALIPFPVWRHVHRVHHRWTGWQDLDLTTELLVPRSRGRLVRRVVDFCWRFWIPVFSLSYRWGNFWSLRRVSRWFPDPRTRRRLRNSLLVQAAVLLALALTATLLLGFTGFLRAIGPALLLAFMVQDVLILSQHTHVPMQRSGGREVVPFPAGKQAAFTRSLRFPRWFARAVLLNMDCHELHHVAPQIPGVDLHRVGWQGPNETSWWPWIRQARRLPGHVFLFQDRTRSGWNG